MKDGMKVAAELAAQGYLLELLLLNLVHSQSNPASLMKEIRFQLESQVHADFSSLGQVHPAFPADKGFVDATLAALRLVFDRIDGQLHNPAPPKYSA